MIPIAKPYLGKEEPEAVKKVLESGMIAHGPKVREMEEKFSKFCGMKYGIAVNSGTAALHTALNTLGIEKGDEVITTTFTFISTANSILMKGAKPIFVDINEDTFNINPDEIKDKITDKTKALIAVDLYGQLCDYERIGKIVSGIKVIEDSCQAVNAEFEGKKAGSFGDLGTFSFYATKNITCGEGGIIVTDNEDLMEKSKLFRQHGRSKMTDYDYIGLGYNYRITDIQAAILLEQLKKVDEITNKRIENAKQLTEGLEKVPGIIVPYIKEGNKHVFHQYTIKLDGFKISRDKLQEELSKKGISTAVFYPKPLHLCSHFKKLGYKEGDFPVAEKVSKEVLSLPVHPHLKKEDIDLIIKSVTELA